MNLVIVAHSFPTIIYSSLLVVLTLYWLVVVIGLLDIDLFHFDYHADGAVEGITGLLLTFGLTGVPVTIVLTFLSFIGWFICAISSYYLFPLIPSDLLTYLVGLVIFVVSIIISVVLTARMIRPLKPLFNTDQAPSKVEFVGQICTVTTGQVTSAFGQGEISQKGASLLIDIRADEPNAFQRGSQVMIIDYDATHDTYWIAESH